MTIKSCSKSQGARHYESVSCDMPSLSTEVTALVLRLQGCYNMSVFSSRHTTDCCDMGEGLGDVVRGCQKQALCERTNLTIRLG